MFSPSQLLKRRNYKAFLFVEEHSYISEFILRSYNCHPYYSIFSKTTVLNHFVDFPLCDNSFNGTDVDILKILYTDSNFRFCSERLSSIIRTMELPDVAELSPLVQVAQFATLLATYLHGFTIIVEPFEDKAPNVSNPVLYYRQVNLVDSDF